MPMFLLKLSKNNSKDIKRTRLKSAGLKDYLFGLIITMLNKVLLSFLQRSRKVLPYFRF